MHTLYSTTISRQPTPQNESRSTSPAAAAHDGSPNVSEPANDTQTVPDIEAERERQMAENRRTFHALGLNEGPVPSSSNRPKPRARKPKSRATRSLQSWIAEREQREYILSYPTIRFTNAFYRSEQERNVLGQGAELDTAASTAAPPLTPSASSTTQLTVPDPGHACAPIPASQPPETPATAEKPAADEEQQPAADEEQSATNAEQQQPGPTIEQPAGIVEHQSSATAAAASTGPSRQSSSPAPSTLSASAQQSQEPSGDLPPWWKDALAYLQTVPGQGEWQNLCDLWITHETRQGFPDGNAPNRVSTDNRPSAVKACIQRHRKYDKPPSDMDAKEFEGRWKACTRPCRAFRKNSFTIRALFYKDPFL